MLDGATRSRLIREDAQSAELLRRFVRGAAVDRWAADWAGEWLLVIPSSGDRRWPWTDADDPESVFANTYPSIYGWMKPMEDKLRARSDKGRYWWELRSCAYYDAFEKPKLVYQEIQFHPCYAFDDAALYGNNKVYMVPGADPWMLAALNAPVLWWHNYRYLPHMKDEALAPLANLMERIPIAPPSPSQRALADDLVPAVVADVAANHRARRGMVDLLRAQYAVEKAGDALANFHRLDADAFVREVVKRRPKSVAKLRPADVAELRALHEAEALPILRREQAVSAAERRLSDAVNAAYGLTDDDLTTLRETAPPRMPPGLPG